MACKGVLFSACVRSYLWMRGVLSEENLLVAGSAHTFAEISSASDWCSAVAAWLEVAISTVIFSARN